MVSQWGSNIVLVQSACSIRTLQYHDLTVSWPYSIMTLQYHDPKVSWPYSIMTLQYHDLTLSWPYSIMALQYHDLTVSWPYSIMTLQYHDLTVSWPYSIMTDTEVKTLRDCKRLLRVHLISCQSVKLFLPKDFLKSYQKWVFKKNLS